MTITLSLCDFARISQ